MRAWREILVGVIVFAGVLAGARYLSALSPEAAPEAGPHLEITWQVTPSRAGDAAFLQALDRLVSALRASGTTVARVSPGPRAATVEAAGLDAAKVQIALGTEPTLRADEVGRAESGNPEVRLFLDEQEGIRAGQAALEATGRAVRERVVEAHPCNTCTPSVQTLPDRVVVGLPVIDSETEKRVRATVEAPPALPLPLRFGGSRIVNPAAPPR